MSRKLNIPDGTSPQPTTLSLPPEVLAKNGQGLRSYGDYAFANSRILEVFAKR
jgi:hypothetical protein